MSDGKFQDAEPCWTDHLENTSGSRTAALLECFVNVYRKVYVPCFSSLSRRLTV